MKIKLNAPQARFLASKSKHAVLLGGRGVGKTTALCYFLLQSIAENAGGLVLIGGQNPAALHSVLLKSFTTLLDEAGIQFVFGSSPPWYESRFHSHVNVLSVSNGWQAICRSLHESGYDRNLRGLEISEAVLDEIRDMQEDVFDVVNACLRQKSGRLRMRMATTPNGKSGWIYKRLVEDKSLNCDVIRCSTMDNEMNLPAGYAEELRRTYSKELYAQEVLGEFVNMGIGLAFRFSRERHCMPLSYDDSKPLLVSLDLNVEPFCGVIGQQHGNSLWILDDVYIKNNGQTRKALQQAKEKYPTSREAWLMVDEAGQARSTRTLETDVSICQDEARRLWPVTRSLNGSSKPRVRDRINALNALLDPVDGEPRFRVDPKARNLIADLEACQWDDSGTKLDKSDRDRTHSIDAANYLSYRLFPPGVGKAFGLDEDLKVPARERQPWERGFPLPVGGIGER